MAKSKGCKSNMLEEHRHVCGGFWERVQVCTLCVVFCASSALLACAVPAAGLCAG